MHFYGLFSAVLAEDLDGSESFPVECVNIFINCMKCIHLW